MPDSILIPISLLQETRNALDVALSLAEPRTVEMPPVKAYSLIAMARKNLDELVAENKCVANGKCVNIHEELEKAIRLANGLHSHLNKLKLVA